jgi:hypothetical protein
VVEKKIEEVGSKRSDVGSESFILDNFKTKRKPQINSVSIFMNNFGLPTSESPFLKDTCKTYYTKLRIEELYGEYQITSLVRQR